MLHGEAQRELLALCAIEGVDRSAIAREAQRPGGLARLLHGELSETSPAATKTKQAIRRASRSWAERTEWVNKQIGIAERVGATITTVLDENYPPNLRLIYNLPPFLFVRGSMKAEDARSVAVVGTRQCTPEGLEQARRMASALVKLGVTVVSGLATGIDTAAHEAAIDSGGRTIAVIGTGITRTYPASNSGLAERVVSSGAIVSQFWPEMPPTRAAFPLRNVVTSGISQGTVVIEASSTSGAKMQARLALEHGKRVFLLRTLVTSQPWARSYLERPGAIEVADASEVAELLRSAERVLELTLARTQLALDIA
jgi:DNA processing protein